MIEKKNSTSDEGKVVLVTGGNGYLASHTIIKLLQLNFNVRATVRTKEKKEHLFQMLEKERQGSSELIEVFTVDLCYDEGWSKTMEKVDYVLHIASPFPDKKPTSDEELLNPSVNGTRRILHFADAAGVKRVVLTSSFAAIAHGNQHRKKWFTEEMWSDINDPAMSVYIKSKTLAEKEAWRFIEQESKQLELTVINPVGLFGPVLGESLSTSVKLIESILNTSLLGFPRLYFGIVDVRDVADLHILAMLKPEAKGQRFLASAGSAMKLKDMAMVLKTNLEQEGLHIKTKGIPDWMVRISALFSASAANLVTSLGVEKHASNQKAREILGWNPRAKEETLVATAESLLRMKNSLS